MEYYAAIKNKEFLPFAAAWMDLESIMLSEISQAMKEKYHIISLMENKEHYKLLNKNRYRGREALNRLSNYSGKAGKCWGAGRRDQPKDLCACI